MADSILHHRRLYMALADGVATVRVQLAIFAVALCVAAFAPPDRGAMLLVPLRAREGTIVNIALGHGAKLLGLGPLPGSVIVIGERDLLLPPMLREGALVVAAVPVICGALPAPSETKP